MQKNRLFAAGLAAALLLGVATPAMAKQPNNKGKKGSPPGHSQPKQKKPAPATKGKKSGVSGGGGVAGGSFSIQARLNSKSKGHHFNYTSTDGLFKVRCREGFEPFTPVLGATEKSASVTFKACKVTGQPGPVPITVKVADRGQPTDKAAQPAVTPAVVDWMDFSVTNAAAVATPYGGNLTSGNVKVR